MNTCKHDLAPEAHARRFQYGIPKRLCVDPLMRAIGWCLTRDMARPEWLREQCQRRT